MVKGIGRRNLIGVCIGGVVMVFGCSDDASTPAAPSVVSSPDASVAVSSPAPPGLVAGLDQSQGGHPPTLAVDDGMSRLKATAPTPQEPTMDEKIYDVRPTLVASNAVAPHVEVQPNFVYQFELSHGETKIRGDGKPCEGKDDSTCYRVERLDLASSYTWQVRAMSEAADGPWSDEAGFKTFDLGVPEPLSPQTDGAFTVRNGTVDGYPGDVYIEIEVASDNRWHLTTAASRTRWAPCRNLNLHARGARRTCRGQVT